MAQPLDPRDWLERKFGHDSALENAGEGAQQGREHEANGHPKRLGKMESNTIKFTLISCGTWTSPGWSTSAAPPRAQSSALWFCWPHWRRQCRSRR